MPSYEDNIYYHPENYDLETVGIVNWRNEPYEFDMTVVWRDSTGMFYWAYDSGCSCPCPFEYTEFKDLNRGSKFDVAVALEQHLMSEDFYGDREQALTSVVDVLQKVMR